MNTSRSNKKLLVISCLLVIVGALINIYDFGFRYKISEVLFGGKLEATRGIAINRAHFVESGDEHKESVPLLEKSGLRFKHINLWLNEDRNAKVIANSLSWGFSIREEPNCSILTLSEGHNSKHSMSAMVYFRNNGLMATLSSDEGQLLKIEDLRFICKNLFSS